MATFKQGTWPFNFGIGISPFKPLDSLVAAHDARKVAYSPPRGLVTLREAAAAFMGPRVGRDVDVSQIVIGAGAKPLIWAIIQVLGKRVVLVEGSWVSYEAHAAMASKEVVWVTVDKGRGKMAWEVLEKILQEDDVLIVNSPSNPWGVVYGEEEKERIGKLVETRRAWLISDDIYWPLASKEVREATRTSVMAHCPRRGILIDSLSKWASCAGWRIGMACFGDHPVLAKALDDAVSITTQTYSCAPVPAQHAALAALSPPLWPILQDALDHQVAVLDVIRDYLWGRFSSSSAWSSERCPLPLVKPQGAFYFFLPMTQAKVGELDDAGIRVVEGEAFGLAGYARISFAAFDGDAILRCHLEEADVGSDGWMERHAGHLKEGIDKLIEICENSAKGEITTDMNARFLFKN